jgi:hypothetical protein
MKLTLALEPGLAISGDLYSQRGHSTYVSSVPRPESAGLCTDSTELYHSGSARLDCWKLAPLLLGTTRLVPLSRGSAEETTLLLAVAL